MKVMSFWPWAALLLALAGCTAENPHGPAEERFSSDEAARDISLRGRLVYRAHGALQPESVAVIELVQADLSGAKGVGQLAEQRIALVGREVPINFQLEAASLPVSAEQRLQLHARIEEEGKVVWQAEPILLDPSEARQDLGEIILLPARAAGFSSILHCGQLQISAGYEGEDLVLQAGTERHRMLPVESESGARFEAEGDPSTRFSTRGANALLTLRGQPLPECVPPGSLPVPFVARGNEPSWELHLEEQRLTLRLNGETLAEAVEYRQSAQDSEGQTYEVEGEPTIGIRVQRAVCQDSMTGMPYPFGVQVRATAGELSGCGGDPSRLLQGVEWIFESLGGRAPVPGSDLAMTFHANDRFSGRASCNNLMGEYALNGETLTFSRAATTRKACDPAVMEQEGRFLELLGEVRGFSFDEDGALLLITAQSVVLKARRL